MQAPSRTSPPKPFVCTIDGCGKRFSKSSNLTQHLRIHSGEKPFECKKCGRRFRQSGNLTKHLKSHENAHLRWNRNTNEKPFKCTFPGCDKSFTAKSSLQNHIRAHSTDSQFYCPIESCRECFYSKVLLSNHMRQSHEFHPQYNCLHPHCKRSFSDEMELRKHLIACSPGIAVENYFLRSSLSQLFKFIDNIGELDESILEQVDKNQEIQSIRRSFSMLSEMPTLKESEGTVNWDERIANVWIAHQSAMEEETGPKAIEAKSSGGKDSGVEPSTENGDILDSNMIMRLEAACGMLDSEELANETLFDSNAGFLGLNMNAWPFVTHAGHSASISSQHMTNNMHAQSNGAQDSANNTNYPNQSNSSSIQPSDASRINIFNQEAINKFVQSNFNFPGNLSSHHQAMFMNSLCYNMAQPGGEVPNGGKVGDNVANLCQPVMQFKSESNNQSTNDKSMKKKIEDEVDEEEEDEEDDEDEPEVYSDEESLVEQNANSVEEKDGKISPTNYPICRKRRKPSGI